MEEPARPASLRRKKWREQSGLWFAEAVIFTFRGVFRISETFAAPKQKQRLRRLRERLSAIEHDKQQILGQIMAGNTRGGLEALNALELRYAKPTEQGEVLRRAAESQSTWAESDTLRTIAEQAGENKSLAVEGYRCYVKDNPNSYSGHSYLAAFLNKVGDIHGSLAAYQEALRLAGENPLRSSITRLHIGEAYLGNDDITSAICEFHNIIEKASSETQASVCFAYLRLGDANQKLGDKVRAKDAWKKAIQWDTSGIVAKKAREKLRSL